MIIKWTNKYSGETGFVKCLNHEGGYFENTFVESEAMNFADDVQTEREVISTLNNWCDSNTYEVIPAECADTVCEKVCEKSVSSPAPAVEEKPVTDNEKAKKNPKKNKK